ncbi:MAG: hypothetical protein ACI4F3_04650 [Enterocloster sp.]
MKRRIIMLTMGSILIVSYFLVKPEANFYEGKETTRKNTGTENVFPTYYTDSIQNLEKNSFPESVYITDRVAAGNHYFIENNILWGTGYNNYWQLGVEKEEDRNNLDSYYETPVKIAENVIHIDASDNGYFTVYLTEDHKLYGLGANTEGVLLQPLQEFEELNYHKNIIGSPVLLMENVQFVSAGRKSLTVLTDDGNVFWWGKFQSTTASRDISCMSSTSPELMVSQAIYTACGSNFALAIDQDNNLWTWGNNVWGECGTDSEDDYLTQAVSVCSQVDMAWPESITFKQNTWTDPLSFDTNPYGEINYPYTLFVKKNDGDIYACGINLGNDKKTVRIHGDINSEENEDGNYTFSYSSELVKIETIVAGSIEP